MPGRYQPDRQGMNTLSLTHKGLQMTPAVEPPLYVLWDSWGLDVYPNTKHC